MHRLRYSLDAAGLLRYQLAKLENPNVVAEWISGGDPTRRIPTLRHSNSLPFELRLRALRLSEVICGNSSFAGNWCSRGVVAAASQGCSSLALRLIEAHLDAKWDFRLEARARRVTRSYWHRLRNGLLESRVLAPNLLDLSDMPSAITPYVIRHRNCLMQQSEWYVISGGDRLSPGRWLWQFDKDGKGRIILRTARHIPLYLMAEKIGIHLNHPRVAPTNGCTSGAWKQVGPARFGQVF